MTWFQVSSTFLAISLLVTPALSAVCPDSCVCTTTRDGLHRATCSNLMDLYKFSIRQKHHNINILDLSHNNITKLSHELDLLTEVVTLDLSTNGIRTLNKFLQNSKKLVHLNLANNRIRSLFLANLPKSISSLDLTNNLLQDVPLDIEYLGDLEHLELKGNPIHCSCDNILIRNRLLASKISIDNVKCISPQKFKGRSWLKLGTKEVCNEPKSSTDFLDMMMGDESLDPIKVGDETNELKSLPLVARNDLEDGKVIHSDNPIEDNEKEFIKVGKYNKRTQSDEISGSGDYESTTPSDFDLEEPKVEAKLYTENEISPDNFISTTEKDSFIEGSGEGSGIGSGFGPVEIYDPEDENIETTTPTIEEFNPDPVPTLTDEYVDSNTTEFSMPKPPSIYEGGNNWHSRSGIVTEKPTVPPSTRDTTVSEQIRVTQASEVLGQGAPSEDKPTPHKTGTYVCIAIIVVLLVGLIGFAIIKGQMRKRRDRRLLRQQKRDVEKASKEMVDMNKSLLGKPALVDGAVQKKINGKYELVPTHDAVQKKPDSGDVGNGLNHNDQNSIRTDSPRDTNQNKNSSRDNNLPEPHASPLQETSFDSVPDSQESKRDNNSLSSEDIFVPLNDDDTPKLNGNADSEVSHPLINGDQNTDSDFLSPSREYVPVYSPDMGRVRIKMSETPKPKTPILVTRSRSNAGDIIITPALDGNMRKSTT